LFFKPGEQILLVDSGEEVVRWLKKGTPPEVGRQAQERVLAEHSSATRAQQFEEAVSVSLPASRASA
jgi:spore maturation protein CgeB